MDRRRELDARRVPGEKKKSQSTRRTEIRGKTNSHSQEVKKRKARSGKLYSCVDRNFKRRRSSKEKWGGSFALFGAGWGNDWLK